VTHLLIVAKTTSYQTYVHERKDARTRDLLARNDPSVRRLKGSHEAHQATLSEVDHAVASLGLTATRVTTTMLREANPADYDLVVSIGGDGTLLTASHELGADSPILGINSAPLHSVGFFCGSQKGRVRRALKAALAGTMKRTVLSRMEVELNGECLSRRVLNDALFCHEVAAVTSRYILTVRVGEGEKEEEEQKSSGLWIGPAAGSTAAQRSAGGKVLSLTSRRLQYVVREPYTPRGKRLSLRRGTVGDGGSLQLRSKMRQGKLFLDGPHVVFDIGLGDVVTLRRSAETLTVLGLSGARRGNRPA
jgi:NAD+ kinase